MPHRSSRRAVLSTLGLLVAAGCTATPGTEREDPPDPDDSVTESISRTATATDPSPATSPRSTETPPGTAGLPTRLWFEPVSLSASERDAIDPIVFSTLSGPEQDIVRLALEEGEYTVETEHESAALERLRDRIEARANGGLAVYLRRGETYYRVGFAAGDHIIAHPMH